MQMNNTWVSDTKPDQRVLLRQRGGQLVIALEVPLVKDLYGVLFTSRTVSRQRDLSPHSISHSMIS